MRLYLYFLGLIFILLLPLLTLAQGIAKTPEMADIMRSNGKIYVVVAVLCVIFLGIVLYIWRLERKLNQYTNQSNS